MRLHPARPPRVPGGSVRAATAALVAVWALTACGESALTVPGPRIDAEPLGTLVAAPAHRNLLAWAATGEIVFATPVSDPRGPAVAVVAVTPDGRSRRSLSEPMAGIFTLEPSPDRSVIGIVGTTFDGERLAVRIPLAGTGLDTVATGAVAYLPSDDGASEALTGGGAGVLTVQDRSGVWRRLPFPCQGLIFRPDDDVVVCVQQPLSFRGGFVLDLVGGARRDFRFRAPDGFDATTLHRWEHAAPLALFLNPARRAHLVEAPVEGVPRPIYLQDTPDTHAPIAWSDDGRWIVRWRYPCLRQASPAAPCRLFRSEFVVADIDDTRLERVVARRDRTVVVSGFNAFVLAPDWRRMAYIEDEAVRVSLPW